MKRLFKNAALIGLGVLLNAGIALAAINTYDFAGRIIYNGLFVGTKTTASASANKVTKILAGSLDYDFPAIGAAGDYAGCRDSFPTSNGGAAEALVGDPCFLGYANPTPYDGGTGTQNFIATCSVVANGVVVVRGCCMQGDGGSCNVDDAGYPFRIISGQ